MPIETKDKLLQIRIDQSLLDRFSVLADTNGATVSAMVRALMRRYVEQVESRARKDAEWDATIASRAAKESAHKQPAGAVVASEGSLAKRRRLEKEAKALKVAKREGRY